MMTAWRRLDRFRKVLVLILAASTLLAAAGCGILSGREGILYEKSFLVRRVQGGDTVYSGRVNGEAASFTVTSSGEVTYRRGDVAYGPYTVTEDPSARPPKGSEEIFITNPDALTGVEVRCAGEAVFRGGYARFSDGGLFLFDETGQWRPNLIVSSGEAAPSAGDAPEIESIILLALGPELTHRGVWQFFWYGLLIAAAAAALIFFADQLFRFNLAFQIRDPESAEPSDWELGTRAVGQVVLTALTVVCYIVCLVGTA